MTGRPQARYSNTLIGDAFLPRLRGATQTSEAEIYSGTIAYGTRPVKRTRSDRPIRAASSLSPGSSGPSPMIRTFRSGLTLASRVEASSSISTPCHATRFPTKQTTAGAGYRAARLQHDNPYIRPELGVSAPAGAARTEICDG